MITKLHEPTPAQKEGMRKADIERKELCDRVRKIYENKTKKKK